MLSESFEALYHLLRSAYYGRIARDVGTGKGSLTATECFCLEVLLLMDKPTSSAFAQFVGISLPSANYRLGSLVEKGYLQKVPSTEDRRESNLIVTPKYADYYGAGNPEVMEMVHRIEQEFEPGALASLISMIDRITEIMREVRETGEADD